MTPPIVVTALYGMGHVPYALALVESLRRVAPYRVVIVHADVDADALALLGRYADLLSFAREDHGESRNERKSGKLAAWARGLDACWDGPVVLLDADTFVVKPLAPAFDRPFDVAHTIRPERRWTINSGVVFVRNSPRVRAWFSRWFALTADIMASPAETQEAIDKWGAQDQFALVRSLAPPPFAGWSVASLPASTWNEDWISDKPNDVAIWHFKGALPALLDPPVDDPRSAQPIFAAWREAYERARRSA